MFRNRGITFKLVFLFTLTGAFIFLAALSATYDFAKDLIEKNVAENARNLTQAIVYRIESIVAAVERTPEDTASFLEYNEYTEAELLASLRSVVEKNKTIYGSTIAFEPDGFKAGKRHFAPYFYRSDGDIKLTYLGGYDYFLYDWYQMPKELARPVWSEPYYDEGGGNIIMATYAAPFYRRDGTGLRRFAGVVTADVSLEWLREIVSSIRILKTGYGFLISRNGTIVTHPHKGLIMNETLFSIAEERRDPVLRQLGREMVAGKSGFAPFTSLVTGAECRLSYAPIPSTGWSLALAFPVNEYLADVLRLDRILTVIIICGTIVLLFAVILIARSITRPLRKMAAIADRIATGDLDVEVAPMKSRDEVGKLATSFRYMKDSLKDYIRRLTEATAARERIESELKIARDIQMSILPKELPPGGTLFEAAAFIAPAREVGGDFYDFFLLNDHTACFLVGDVSGKGVPAALFMAVAKTLFKAAIVPTSVPGEVMAHVNRELLVGNDACMFATVFLGIIDFRTGELRYANGGHNLPLIVRADGTTSFACRASGTVVGAVEDAVFATVCESFRPGDGLFLYTDGVTEAMNERNELFSDERLERELTPLAGASTRSMIDGILAAVRSFAAGREQTDDITIMALRRGRDAAGAG